MDSSVDSEQPSHAAAPLSDSAPQVPRVTVIINCYNGAEFLAQAVESALSQTYTDWELLLFDDCSTDHSAEVFRRYNDSRLHYVLAPQPLNLSQARQAALALARGEWVAFLDQDDVWHADKLARQMAIAEQDSEGRIGLIYGRARRFGARDSGRDFDHHFEDALLPEGDVYHTLLTVSNFVPMSAAMIRRAAYQAIAAVPRHIRLCPDLYFWLALSRTWQVRALQDECCLYRVHAGGLTSVHNIQIFTEFLAIIEHFGDSLDGATLAMRRRNSQTLIAVAEIAAGYALRGITRVLREGSLRYLFGRALAWLVRESRRRLRGVRR